MEPLPLPSVSSRSAVLVCYFLPVSVYILFAREAPHCNQCHALKLHPHIHTNSNCDALLLNHTDCSSTYFMNTSLCRNPHQLRFDLHPRWERHLPHWCHLQAHSRSWRVHVWWLKSCTPYLLSSVCCMITPYYDVQCKKLFPSSKKLKSFNKFRAFSLKILGGLFNLEEIWQYCTIKDCKLPRMM